MRLLLLIALTTIGLQASADSDYLCDVVTLLGDDAEMVMSQGDPEDSKRFFIYQYEINELVHDQTGEWCF